MARRLTPNKPLPYLVRLTRLVSPEPTSGCWLWTGVIGANGYGKFRIPGGKWAMAHRAMWTETRGPIPPGKLVLHKCDNPVCVNPDHLYVGTDGDNMRNRAARRRHPMQRDSPFYDKARADRTIAAMLAGRGIIWTPKEK